MNPLWRDFVADDARSSIEQFSDVEGSVLVALQTLQEIFGYVPDEALDLVADVCNVSRAEVYGVQTFYSDLRSTKPSLHDLKVCVAEACQASGSASLVAAMRTELGFDVDAATAEGDVDVTRVYCLGNCALGPAVLVDGRLLGRASVASVTAALGGRA